jgi:hypothetical protein
MWTDVGIELGTAIMWPGLNPVVDRKDTAFPLGEEVEEEEEEAVCEAAEEARRARIASCVVVLPLAMA